MMHGQMTAGSWIYICSQGIVQGTYETFVEEGRKHYAGDLSGKWILTAGLGGMWGNQPLAAAMADGCYLSVVCDPQSVDFRLRTGYVDERADSLDQVLEMITLNSYQRIFALYFVAVSAPLGGLRSQTILRIFTKKTKKSKSYLPMINTYINGWIWRGSASHFKAFPLVFGGLNWESDIV
jgi:hypothetical protein